MKFRHIVLSAFFLVPSLSIAADWVPTPEQIKEAEMTRAAYIKIGMDKVEPEEVIAYLAEMDGGEKEVTQAQKDAMACVIKKGQYIQLEAPIEVLARQLSDEAFREELDAKHAKECGIKVD